MFIIIHPQVPQYSRPPDHLIIIHPLMHLIQNRNRLLLLVAVVVVVVTSFLICS